MRTPWKTWCLFTGALLVVLTAMGWISVVTLRLERTKNEAQVQAALEENVRLALWRMESSLAPLLPQESARHYFVYSAFKFFHVGAGPGGLITQRVGNVFVH